MGWLECGSERPTVIQAPRHMPSSLDRDSGAGEWVGSLSGVMHRTADAVTQCKFEATDRHSDEVVLFKILQVSLTQFLGQRFPGGDSIYLVLPP